MSNQAGLTGVTITSAGCKLPGALYRAGGAGPHPTALVLHGLPGLEKNTDIAYALRDAGWNALIFHYRGCWGGEGDYTLAGIPDDVRAAVDALLSGEFEVDAARIVLIGHGLGGWAAVVAASRDPRIRAVVTMGGMSNLRTMSLKDQDAADYSRFLRNITGKGIQSQWRALQWTHNPVDVVDLLPSRRLLIVHGTADEVAPVSQATDLKDRAGDAAEMVLLQGADHFFSRHRAPLVDAIVGWLKTQL